MTDLDASIRARASQALAYVIRAARHASRGRLAEAAADLSAPEALFRSQPLFPLLRCKLRLELGEIEAAREDLRRAKEKAGPAWEFQSALERLETSLARK
jgi:hypothetical protein